MMSKAYSSVPFTGTPEQEKALREAMAELMDVPGALMPTLQRAQGIYGYLPYEVMEMISNTMGFPMSEIYGVATFYAQFSLSPKGKYEIGVCLGTACYVKGSGDIFDKFSERLKIKGGECTKDAMFSLVATRCIGCCGLAPVATVNEEVYGKLTVEDVDKILNQYDFKG